jgi:hypothetical protein
MTLHSTTDLVKKAGIGSAVGIISIILIVVFIRVGVGIKNILFPPQKEPPTQSFGLLPAFQFPKTQINSNFIYNLQTTTGELPADLPDRLSIFPITHNTPNFLNLEKVKKKAAALEFISQGGGVLPEIQLTNPYYEWDELTGFNRKIIFNINSYDFRLTSNYLSSLTVLSSQFISDEPSAIKTAQDFLDTAGLTPKDLDISKTTNQNNPVHYVTYPQLYSIQNDAQGNTLVRTTSLSKAQVIRVDFYQKDAEYDLNTGGTGNATPKVHVKIPILYPLPPYSTMSFWVASGPRNATVTQAFFTHQDIDFTNASATYGIKRVEDAFTELKDGKAYIAAYNGTDTNILIKDVYLAYYLGEDSQPYLIPMYVFEGNNGFFAYILAVTENQFQK